MTRPPTAQDAVDGRPPPATAGPLPNPFCSRWVRPQANSYQFPAGEDAAQCARRLRQCRCAQVVGPHGSGKSTFMHSLAAWWSAQLGPATLWRVDAGGVATRSERRGPAGPRLCCVDGWDSLPWWRRLRWMRPQSAGQYWLITTHQPRRGWAVLRHCRPSLSEVIRLTQRLQVSTPPALRVPESVVRQAFLSQQGNVREILFALYDHFEDARADGRGA